MMEVHCINARIHQFYALDEPHKIEFYLYVVQPPPHMRQIWAENTWILEVPL